MKNERTSPVRSSIALVIAANILGMIGLMGAEAFATVDAIHEPRAAKGNTDRPRLEAQAAPRKGQPPAPAPANPGLPADSPPAAAAPVRTESVVYDNWTVTCRDTVGGTAKKICSASFQMTERDRNAVIFTWLIGRNNEGALISLMQVPTGLLITSGLQLKIDNGTARKLDFTLCDEKHCEASIQMGDALTKEMADAKAATATIFTPDGRGINFNIIPKGIDKAIAFVLR